MKSEALNTFRDTISENRLNGMNGVYSVCSSHPDVLYACFLQAREDNSMLLVESTSNQVDQFGGYTGMVPADFIRLVYSIAARAGFSQDKILLGGDHLGPNPWKHLPAEKAMTYAENLIKAYVIAGYRKIHLDTSMRCSDDPVTPEGQPDNQLVAERTVQLCRVAEDTWKEHFIGHPGLVYVIGTEVPVPGGSLEQDNELKPTEVSAAHETLHVNRSCFHKAGLDEAWERVCGLVVQPGVEFGDDHVIRYKPENGTRLSRWILEQENLVFEAHSTDYQTESSLRALVADHFGILKVGPWLTFAYREAVFALEAMENEIPATLGSRSNLSETLEYVMNNDDRYWKSHYRGDEASLRQKLRFSFSDRSRYYWTHSLMQVAVNKLIANLIRNPAPLSLLSQYMPIEYRWVTERQTVASPLELVHCHIRNVAQIYSSACGWKKQN